MRRHEIVFAVCAVESYLFEWVRDTVLAKTMICSASIFLKGRSAEFAKGGNTRSKLYIAIVGSLVFRPSIQKLGAISHPSWTSVMGSFMLGQAGLIYPNRQAEAHPGSRRVERYSARMGMSCIGGPD